MPKARNPEEVIHVKTVAILRDLGVWFWHTPNESKATVAYRRKLHQLGLSPGVPDLVIVTPPPVGSFVGAVLELKSERGRVSEYQKEWIERFRKCGWATAVTFGLDATIAQLTDWGYIGEHSGRPVGRAGPNNKQPNSYRIDDDLFGPVPTHAEKARRGVIMGLTGSPFQARALAPKAPRPLTKKKP
jgi:hypothetical protein